MKFSSGRVSGAQNLYRLNSVGGQFPELGIYLELNSIRAALWSSVAVLS